ncbi:hypothetical protein SAMN05216360_102119 [Methylobacterium phyllostachyos]|uniref:Uncharacterized protein n=1 Tax=Methylobacterium phyllostachyos TaxID=582672 RepID=A0A1G9TBY1_9HYPH|nr:hypothetical protein SAMN05216360_102119 [Methylobacterium phyllostachyos]
MMKPAVNFKKNLNDGNQNRILAVVNCRKIKLT